MGKRQKWGKGRSVTGSAADMRQAVVDVQEYLYGPDRAAQVVGRAGPPPRLDHPAWKRCCIGRDRDCGTCVICVWVAEANRWHDWSPWREGMESKLKPANPRPGFNHIDAAIRAWYEWELNGRHMQSGAGPILELIKQGAQFSGARVPKRDNALLKRSDSIVHIDKALTRACAEPESWGLEADLCRAMLIARAHGVLDKQPTFDAIAKIADVTATFARRVVKVGRRALQVELSARGLVPMPARTSGLHWDIDVRRQELGVQT